jgi:glycosyltransferase involved in cell wall biosynthesis
MSSRRRVLLYSPDLYGHRQVYCERWARVLLARGFDVCVAASFKDVAQRKLLPEFAGVLDEPAVTRVDVGVFPGAGLDIDAAGLSGLVARTATDVTVLLEADDLLPALCGQLGRHGVQVPGRRVGLFIRSTNYQYPGRKPLRTELGWLRRLPRGWRAWPRLFHEVLMPRYRLLDAALCLDEHFVASHARTHQWMPDVFQPSCEAQVGSSPGAPSADERRLAGRLRTFLEDHPGREVFVYYGTAYVRRGYDTLLRLALRRRGCFIHCGGCDDEGARSGDVRAIRAELERRGDLFETDGFVADFATAELFFGAAPAIVLPYRRHLGSSGVMLQALRAGRPVLVPDEGLMGRRVRQHGLGAVYDPRDEGGLDRAVTLLWARSPEQFAAPIGGFLRYFSPDRVERAILDAVEGRQGGCPLPVVCSAASSRSSFVSGPRGRAIA